VNGVIEESHAYDYEKGDTVWHPLYFY